MSIVTGNRLSLDELQRLANEPEAARQSIHSIMLALSVENEEMRGWAVEALENMGPPPVESITELVDWTSHNSIPFVCWSCKLIGRLEKYANRYQHDLASLVQAHDNLSVRQEAAAVLSKIGSLDEETVRMLNLAVTRDDPRLKRMIAAAIANSA